jgi:23S rRNA (adenine2503-C2)-methyltransferase
MNYNNMMKAIEMITSSEGLRNVSKENYGFVRSAKMIKKLADDDVKVKLAVSLHSAIDEIVPKSCPSVKFSFG